jgi:hypothetical protein
MDGISSNKILVLVRKHYLQTRIQLLRKIKTISSIRALHYFKYLSSETLQMFDCITLKNWDQLMM